MNNNSPSIPTNAFGKTSFGTTGRSPFQISSSNSTLYQPLQPQIKKGQLHNQNMPKSTFEGIIKIQDQISGFQKPSSISGGIKANEIFPKGSNNPLNNIPSTVPAIFSNPTKGPTFPFQNKPNNTVNMTSNIPNTNPFANFANQNKGASNIFNKNQNPISLPSQPAVNHSLNSNIFNQTSKPQTTNNSPINNIFSNNSTNKTNTTTNSFNPSNPFNVGVNQSTSLNNQQPSFNMQSTSNNVSPFNNPNNSVFQQTQQQQQIFGQNQNTQPFQFSNSTNIYLQHFQNYLRSQAPFQSQLQNTIPNQQIFNSNPLVQSQFNQLGTFPFNSMNQPHPHANQPYGNYHMFLNNAVNSDSLKRAATPNELFAFAQGWANTQMKSDRQQGSQQQSKAQIKKLFEYNADPTQINIQMRELPPIETTLELLERMNDPFTCKLILSELWARLKKQVEDNLKFLNLPATQRSQVKVRDLAFHREMGVVWKQLKILQERVNQMVEKDMTLNRLRQNFCFQASQLCQHFQQRFIDFNRNNQLLEDASLQVEMVSDFLEKNVMQIFKSYLSNQPITIYQPDPFILEVSSFILTRLTTIEGNISDLLAINNHSDETVSCLEIAQNMCQFYEQIAMKLYQVSEKIKKCVNLGARSRAYGNNEDLLKHIQQKANKNIAKKLQVYNQLKEIQHTLEKRGFRVCFGRKNLLNKVENVSPLSINHLEFVSEPMSRIQGTLIDRAIETDNSVVPYQ